MKTISLGLLLVGTIVGAGFASGREALSFFGENAPLAVAPIVGAGIFLISVLFLFIGREMNAQSVSEVNQKLLGKAHAAADIFLLFNSLIILAGMLACLDNLFALILPLAPFYSIAGGIICAFIVSKGLKGLLRGNSLIVPVVIAAIILVCGVSIKKPVFYRPFNAVILPSAIIYVCMNMMLAATVFTTVKGVSTANIIGGSAIAGGVVTALLALIISALNSTGFNGAMPLMEMADYGGRGLFYLSLTAVAISIFTTVMTAMAGLSNWLGAIIGDKKYSVIIVLLVGIIVSNAGFEAVVTYLYPIIGVLGAVYISLCVIYLIKQIKSKKSRKPQKMQKQGLVAFADFLFD